MDIEELGNSPVMKRIVQEQLKGIREEAKSNRELDKTTYEELFEDFAGLFPTEGFEKNGIKSKRNFNGAFYEFSSLADVQAAFDGSDGSGWMEKLEPFDVLPDGVKEEYYAWDECAEVIRDMCEVSGFLYLDNEWPMMILCKDRVFAVAPYAKD